MIVFPVIRSVRSGEDYPFLSIRPSTDSRNHHGITFARKMTISHTAIRRFPNCQNVEVDDVFEMLSRVEECFRIVRCIKHIESDTNSLVVGVQGNLGPMHLRLELLQNSLQPNHLEQYGFVFGDMIEYFNDFQKHANALKSSPNQVVFNDEALGWVLEQAKLTIAFDEKWWVYRQANPPLFIKEISAEEAQALSEVDNLSISEIASGLHSLGSPLPLQNSIVPCTPMHTYMD